MTDNKAGAVPSFQDYFISSERDRLNAELDTATTIGDAAKVRAIATKLVELEKRAGNPPPAAPGAAGAGKPGDGATGAGQQMQGADGKTWTVDQARAAIEKQAPWFGSDPEMTKAAFEVANFIAPRKYKSPEDYAKAVQEAVEKKFNVEPEDDDGEATEGEGGEGEPAAEGEGGEGEPAADGAVRRTPPKRAPASAAGVGASRVSGAGASRVPTKFSQITNAEQRKKLQAMALRQKLDEKTVVGNWYNLEQKKIKAAKSGSR